MMKVLIFLLLNLMSISTYANSDCKLKTPVTFISWTGVCSDGYVDGIGELAYQFSNSEGKLTRIQTFGKVNQGIPTGLHSSTADPAPTTQFSTYFTNGGLEQTGVLVASDSSNQQLPLSKRYWGAKANDGENKSITYEDALNKIKTYIAHRNQPSIDFEIFKAYLEGRVKVTGEDDSPATGIALKPTGGKAKRKK